MYSKVSCIISALLTNRTRVACGLMSLTFHLARYVDCSLYQHKSGLWLVQQANYVSNSMCMCNIPRECWHCMLHWRGSSEKFNGMSGGVGSECNGASDSEERPPTCQHGRSVLCMLVLKAPTESYLLWTIFILSFLAGSRADRWKNK